jgi:hypothetical protein
VRPGSLPAKTATSGTHDDGEDFIYGDDDDDKIYGGDGNDILIGDSGNDNIDGGYGNDYLESGFGDDFYHFGYASGKDFIYEDDGSKYIDTIEFEMMKSDAVEYMRNNDKIKLTYIKGKRLDDTKTMLVFRPNITLNACCKIICSINDYEILSIKLTLIGEVMHPDKDILIKNKNNALRRYFYAFFTCLYFQQPALLL